MDALLAPTILKVPLDFPRIPSSDPDLVKMGVSRKYKYKLLLIHSAMEVA